MFLILIQTLQSTTQILPQTIINKIHNFPSPFEEFTITALTALIVLRAYILSTFLNLSFFTASNPQISSSHLSAFGICFLSTFCLYSKSLLTYIFISYYFSLHLQQMSVEWPTFTHGRIHQIKHRKKWQLNQTLKYYHYVILNKNTLEVADRNKKHQVYNRMAKCIGTRNTHQCRSHHQKIVKRFGSIDKFCKTFKAKNPRLFDPSPKLECVEESFSDSKKIYSDKSQENIRSLQKSSKNVDDEGQSSGERDSESEKVVQDRKGDNSEEFGEKSGKQYVSKNGQSGTKISEGVEMDSKTKKIRRKRRISYRLPEIKQENNFGEQKKIIFHQFTPCPNLPPQPPIPLSKLVPAAMEQHTDQPIPLAIAKLSVGTNQLDLILPYASALMLTNQHVGRRDKLLDEPSEPDWGILGQRKEMGGFGFGESRPMAADDDMWMMVLAKQGLDMQGTGTSARGDEPSDMPWPKPPHHEIYLSCKPEPQLPYQMQHNFSFHQVRQPQPGYRMNNVI